MGNEKSQPTGLSIDDTATEVTDNWSLHGATYSIGSIPKISVFMTCKESVETTHLEKFSKNVMIYRHPCILKYITSWKKGTKFHLATEQVQPLAQVLPSQTLLQICVGLQNILKALVFLHEFGSASHNNVCQAAVYVSQGGSWKLGGLEYLCRFNEMNCSYLEETRNSRYDKAVAPNEGDHFPQPPNSIDAYAFGIFAQEVLTSRSTDDVPGMADFLEICKNKLQSSSPQTRPLLSSLLNHSFFSHEFLLIHNFLLELPIKKNDEKQEFFRSLVVKLCSFPEEIVASQLGSLLLSRMVLLDLSAQKYFLPQVFIPRKEEIAIDSLFSEATFRTHMIPRLLPLFCVRDVHIRLILLSHFSAYCSLFSQVQLQTRVLPELLVGIKDTNDAVVSATLRALAELVPVLGGAVVIGGNRAKLFSDGRPKAVKSATKLSTKQKHLKTETPLLAEVGESECVALPERASPDGGEYVPAVTNSEEDEAWPEWEVKINEQTNATSVSEDNPKFKISDEKLFESEVDILNSKVKHKDEVEDIFRDMEPVISKPQIIQVVETRSSDKFALSMDVNEGTVDGWGDDFEDWSEVEGSTDSVKINLSILNESL